MAKIKATAEKITRRITSLPDKKLGILDYDFDNLYPQRIIDIVNDSGTAKACIKLFAKYVTGNGATDVDFYKAKVNDDGLTADKLIRKMAISKGKTPGIAIHISYNGLGQAVEATPIPFEYCRLTDPAGKHEGKICVYQDWALNKTRIKVAITEKTVDYIDFFKPEDVLAQMERAGGAEKYKGQILYWTPEGRGEYALAEFDAVLEDMQTEAQTKRFKSNTAKKNFLASHILITGKQEEAVDENGDIIDNSGEFDESLTQFQGGDGSGTILQMEVEGPEDVVRLEKVDIQDYDGLYEFTEGSAQESIRKAFLVPSALLQNSSTGFSQDEINNAKTYYSDVTSDDRLVIEEILRDIFSIWHTNICPSGDYSIMPIKVTKPVAPEMLPYYSKNEIREKNGDAPAEDAKSDVTILAVTLGVGGTQSLTAIIADPIMTLSQKQGAMEVLFGLTPEQSSKMLGIEVTPINTRP